MIYYREWKVQPKTDIWLNGEKQSYKMCGWFLFGFIPLYIKRFGIL